MLILLSLVSLAKSAQPTQRGVIRKRTPHRSVLQADRVARSRSEEKLSKKGM